MIGVPKSSYPNTNEAKSHDGMAITDLHRSLGRFLRRWFLARDRKKRVVAWLAVCVVLSVPLFKPPRYSLAPLYTDHMRHAYAAWALLNIGPEVFTTPIASWDFGASHPFDMWATLPHLYPIGSLILFLPFGVAINLELVPEPIVNMAMVMLFGVCGVVASWLLYRTLSESYRPVLLGAVLVIAVPSYVFWGLNGFFDTVAVVLALVGVRAYRHRNDGTAMVALVCALSLHYRLWYLGPLAVVAAARYWRTNGVVDRQLGLVGVLGAGSLASFFLTVPGLLALTESPLFHENPIALTAGTPPKTLLALGSAVVVLAVVYRYESDPTALVTLTLAAASVFTVTQWLPWYPVLLTPTLALADRRQSHVALVIGFYLLTFLHWKSANVLYFGRMFLRATVGLG
jgi:hypothetical protein